VPLNIYARQSSGKVAQRRDRLTDDLLGELTAWNPREWITAIKRWHRGPLGALTLVHLNVIAELEMNGQMSMGQLADALDVSVASATGIVSRMEHRGLVERRHGGSDRRVVMVGPTATGSRIFGEMEARRRARLAKLLEHLTDDEMAGFATGLRALRKARTDDAAAAVLTSSADATSGAGGNGNEP
jgi:DNA-binding MarR family transcriptional regulator